MELGSILYFMIHVGVFFSVMSLRLDLEVRLLGYWCSFCFIFNFDCVLSSLFRYDSDKIAVKQLTIPVKNFTGDGGHIRFAMISDIHAGASVYREQVCRFLLNQPGLGVRGLVLVQGTEELSICG